MNRDWRSGVCRLGLESEAWMYCLVSFELDTNLPKDTISFAFIETSNSRLPSLVGSSWSGAMKWKSLGSNFLSDVKSTDQRANSRDIPFESSSRKKRNSLALSINCLAASSPSNKASSRNPYHCSVRYI